MRRRCRTLFGAGLLLWAFLCAGAVAGESPGPEARWILVGEEIVYRAYWGRISVGESVATTAWVEEDGRRLIRVRFRTRSNRVLSTLYPVDDVVETFIDPETFLPIRFVKNLSEGRYRAHEVTEFDHEAGIARWRSLLRDRERDFDIEPDTRDLITFMYFMRNAALTPGERIQARVMADEKLYDVYVDVHGEERIRVRGDRIRSYMLEPEAAFEGVFVRRGRMWIWISADERQMLTRLSAEIPVAHIHLLLDEVRRPGERYWIETPVVVASPEEVDEPRELEEPADPEDPGEPAEPEEPADAEVPEGHGEPAEPEDSDDSEC